ncbi:phosphate-starvation-inducible PsiE family protein [Clostridium sp. D53t1_180928_C8]|uniref:phosphate-starvation-inducible PsiE family protein n=1 Tax=Clostridium sp. D53t1_180928_C8 TaxID=2787101 RepID=UPI0018AC0A60|nr:phosphate-starvation-inducible PsiE family protein [Clostridium sp. D53t1_180928_C8]
MKKFIKEKVMKFADILETIISVLLAICIAISVIYLIFDLTSMFTAQNRLDAFNNYLSTAFNFVIGIEFIKMLCKHTPQTVIEVLLFAIARQLIVEHMSIFQSLIGIIAIGALFAIRKYLFYNFDEIDKTIYRGSERVKRINLLEHIEIPYDNKEDTLEDVLLKEIDARKLELGTGVCIYYKGFALKVERIKNNVITRVEVIRSIKKDIK